MEYANSSVDCEVVLILKNDRRNAVNNSSAGSAGVYGKILEIGPDYVRLGVQELVSFKSEALEEVFFFEDIKKIYSIKKILGVRQ